MFPHASGATPRARRLRRDTTDPERRLWAALREALPAAKWRRQVPVGPYIVDFLSFPQRLVIEVDGGQHGDQVEQDEARTRYLESIGLRVIRFWNADVMTNIAGVIEAIMAVTAQSPSPSPNPLPSGRGLSGSSAASPSPGRERGWGEGER